MSRFNQENRQLGIQPLDEILKTLEFSNSDLVEASSEQLTHKQVQKCRQGRRVTKNIQNKVLNALNHLSDKTYSTGDLFTYEAE